MTGEYELLKKVLSTIEVKEGLNKDNIIEEIQEELKDQGLYKEWEKGKFDVNHGFGTFLIIAARNGYTKTVGVLLGAGADVNAKGGFECTALRHAASFGRKEIVEFLISKEADVNAKDSLGRTALNHAALCGRKEIVEFLISKEADVNAKDVFNRTALHHAAFDDHTKITKVLFEKGVDLDVDEFPLLYNGAKNGRVGTVGILLQKGANVNAVDKNGKTPLDYAKDQNVVKVLLDAGGRSFVKARNKAMIAGGVTTLLGTAIAVALFTTGTITAQLIPIVIAVVAVTAAALVVGCATYGLLKPSTKVDGAEKPIVNSINEQQGVTGISS